MTIASPAAAQAPRGSTPCAGPRAARRVARRAACGRAAAACSGQRVVSEDLRTDPNWVAFQPLVQQAGLAQIVQAALDPLADLVELPLAGPGGLRGMAGAAAGISFSLFL